MAYIDTYSGVSFNDGSIDEVERVHCWKGNAEDTEKGDETWIHLIPSTSCLSHSSNKAKVFENFVFELLSSIIYAPPVQQQLQKCNRLLCTIIIHLKTYIVLFLYYTTTTTKIYK